MIIKSVATKIDYPQHFPIAPIRDNEKCCVCESKIPENATVLRRKQNNNIICVICLVEIAEVND